MEVDFDIVDDNRDSNADSVIRNCFDLSNPKSFFLFAGAGSGKTKSLVSALEYINTAMGRDLRLSGRRVAVITYTNAARDEIKRRSRYNSLFEISTIHSFAWNIVCSHTTDIREWLRTETIFKIDEAELKQSASRNKGTKTYKETEKKLAKLRQRLSCLDTAKHFIYNPDGLNTESNSLDHAEVIKMSAEMLLQKDTLQKILIDKYPILLIDESQDTKKDLMDAFLLLQNKYSDHFTVGLFGDVMQRVYLEGKNDLHTSVPANWITPSKIMNHRSRKRIVDLCNHIRKPVDGIEQKSRVNKPGGCVRVFVADHENPRAIEQSVRCCMAEISEDEHWRNIEEVKTLTLEHKMAAKRLGFEAFYSALDSVPSYKQGLRDGSLSVIGLFTHVLLHYAKPIGIIIHSKRRELLKRTPWYIKVKAVF